jgi:hypothetical protein
MPETACRVAVAVLGLTLIISGCASGHPSDLGMRAASSTAPAARPAAGGTTAKAGARYLAIAVPANHSLDAQGDSLTDHEHDDLAVAEAALRAEAATERRFDQLLAEIPFPAQIAATARTLIRVNQSRIELTEQQARSSSIAELLSFTSRHQAADAAVEAQTRTIRQELGLPPPPTS